MQQNSLILSECQEINSPLYKPISTTQRIKYTCLNISSSFIILGSTSGSLFLFTRDPCVFQQLIPLSEGVISQILISPDEKMIALATTRGKICLVILKPAIKLLAVSTGHLNEYVTCLCWNTNSNELYIGDSGGKISVMVLTIFTVNGMFQVPPSVLMHLDSSIVQMDFASSLLLISTLTRCYICDTIQEQYKQIGNKARDGGFGACFYRVTHVANKTDVAFTRQDGKSSNKTRLFSLITAADNDVIEENSLKIYCARPGSRLWEVTSNGTVIKTHQFRDALAIPPSTVHKLNSPISQQSKPIIQEGSAQSTNFSRLYVIDSKYLFTYTSNGMYIINPTNAAVVLWNNEFTEVATIDVIENKIYLMTHSGRFHCLTLVSVDSLILQLYDNKQYSECLQMCMKFRSHLETTEICNVELTLNNITENSNIAKELNPLILIIRSHLHPQLIKLNSGIVIVNPGNAEMNEGTGRNWAEIEHMNSVNEKALEIQDFDIKDEDLSSFKESNEIDNSYENIKNHQRDNTEHSDVEDQSKDLNATTEVYKECINNSALKSADCSMERDLEPLYTLSNSIKVCKTNVELEQIISEIRENINNLEGSYKEASELKTLTYKEIRTAELHYSNDLLQYVSTDLSSTVQSKLIFEEIVRCFIIVNTINGNECICGFFYPNSNLEESKYFEVGKMILKKFANENTQRSIYLCTKVPYMWREYLLFDILGRKATENILRLCFQTRDNVILSIILPWLDTKQWSLLNDYIEQIERGLCLSCGETISKTIDHMNSSSIDWNGIAYQIMKKEGPDSAMAFLIKLQSILPNIAIDASTFQSLIFTKILECQGVKHSVNFNSNRTVLGNISGSLCSKKIRDNLACALEKDLGRSVDKNLFGSGTHHWGMRYKPRSSVCPCCTLSLQTPVLLNNNGLSFFPCGHVYHVTCLLQKKLSKCNLHS